MFKKLIIMLKNCCNELEDMFFPKKLKENMNSKTLKFSNKDRIVIKKWRNPKREICLSKEIGKSKEAKQNAI